MPGSRPVLASQSWRAAATVLAPAQNQPSLLGALGGVSASRQHGVCSRDGMARLYPAPAPAHETCHGADEAIKLSAGAGTVARRRVLLAQSLVLHRHPRSP